MRALRLLSLAASATVLVALTGCAQSTAGRPAASGSAGSSAAFPVTITNTYGTTTITKKPTRIATVAWTNGEVPLALGVVPVGMAKVTWGDDDGDGVLPWAEDRLTALGAKTPVLFDETDGIDFEAVADTKPDVILAAYSGLTKSDYETLSKIAPVVSFPDLAWGTSLADTIELDSRALGLGAEGKALVSKLSGAITASAGAHDDLPGKSAMFAYFDPTDLSKVGFYTTHDPRAGFFGQLGMVTPKVVTDTSETSKEFYATVSAENADSFADVDVIVTYGDDTLLQQLQADPLLSKIPAIERGSVVLLPNSTPLAASANPSPLSIGWGVDEYTDLLADAADRVS